MASRAILDKNYKFAQKIIDREYRPYKQAQKEKKKAAKAESVRRKKQEAKMNKKANSFYSKNIKAGKKLGKVGSIVKMPNGKTGNTENQTIKKRK